MFGVLMSVQPLNPTSFQPRSSATMWTMLGFLSAPIAAAAKPAVTSAVRMVLVSVVVFKVVSFRFA